jgi:hypothetical protein
MNIKNRPQMPRAQIYYGEIIYWITIMACIICMIGPVLSLASPENNILNPYKLFDSIFEGKTAEEVWQNAGDGFPGGHFYLDYFTHGDGFTQFGLALGCSVAIWGLLGAAIAFFRKKQYLFVILGLWVAFLVTVSMTGIVSSGH